MQRHAGMSIQDGDDPAGADVTDLRCSYVALGGCLPADELSGHHQ